MTNHSRRLLLPPRVADLSFTIGFHVMFRLLDRRPLATTAAALREIACVMLRIGEQNGLLAFGVADDHLHAMVVIGRVAAGTFARSVENALHHRLRLGVRFEPARIIPLRDQGHASSTFHYVQRQDERHAIHRDPFREGTSLPDLLGARVIDSGSTIVGRVRANLQRVTRDDLLAHFPRGVFDERPIALDGLADAAAAALALPDLSGRGPDVSKARLAAVHVAGPETPTKLLAESLCVGSRAIQLLRAAPRDLRVERAVRMQALLRTPMRAASDAA